MKRNREMDFEHRQIGRETDKDRAQGQTGRKKDRKTLKHRTPQYDTE